MTHTKALVSLAHISFQFGANSVLRDLSCELRRGEHTAIVGANGSGKSTLLRILTGEAWPLRDGGARLYSLDGSMQTASPLLVKPYIRRIAPEMHERFLRLGLRIDVEEFVASGVADRDYPPVDPSPELRERVRGMLQRLHLERVAKREARTLSHGTLRRAFIARALMASPRILALDEITDGLDEASRASVLATLDACVAEGTTLVCVAHRLERIPACVGRVLRLSDGTLVPFTIEREARRHVAALPEPEAIGEATPLVDIRDASVIFDEQPALRDVTLTMTKGEHIALCGANGAGKSTLVGLIDGTYLPSRGTIVRHGFARRPSIWEIRRRFVTLSAALQARYDWDIAVRDVLASGYTQSIGFAGALSTERMRRIEELEVRFGLREFRDRSLAVLSFGQRRRVLLARACVETPDMLLLDEVFDGLDAMTTEMLAGELVHLASAGCTVVCIEHDPAQVPRWIRRRLTLAEGRLVQDSVFPDEPNQK